MEGKVQGISSINGRYKIDRGRLRIVEGSGEAKELIRITHGHELRGGLLEGLGVPGRGGQRGKIGTTLME